MRYLFVALALVALVAPALADRRVDEHSFAEPTKVKTKHLALDLKVDFKAKQLAGTATLELEWLDPTAKLVLDTRDLAIVKVEAADGKRLRHVLGKRDKTLGSKLTIDAKGAPSVRITYRTSPKASGLQWMPASLTATGKHPFMFSQSQAIHARSWVPLQDTPGIRFTYAARIRTPKDLVAVMSADNDPEVVRDGDYELQMKEPIPSYLLAIAVGDLAFKPISKRCGVWAERPVVDRALSEFADTEAMIAAAEKLYGPYRWGRYDILVLPASFPFGGMENPRLSFITPTILVGDRSLTSLIAHELAHSWSGNLVTNATWKDVWLNEGFTTYVEYRIVEAIYGKDQAEVELHMSQQSLRKKLPEVPKPRQVLRFVGTAADADGLGEVAYEKGQWFLLALEKHFGRAAFDAFLKAWFDEHAFQSVTTDDFVRFIATKLNPRGDKAIEQMVLAWVDGDGIPASAPQVTSARLVAIDDARAKWLAATAPGGLRLLEQAGAAKWGTIERVHFLEGLPKTLRADQLEEMDTLWKLTGTQNGELAQRWYPLTIRSGHTKTRPAIVAFIERVGRRKLIIPIYRAFAATPEGLAFATRTFARVKANYHPLTIEAVAAVLAKPAK